jgi:hypothetical protein
LSLNRLTGFGVTLGVDVTGGSTFVTLASIVTPPSGPSAKTEKVDVSILSDKSKQYAGAQIDPGEVSFEIAYDLNDVTTTTLATLLGNSAIANWQITYTAGTIATETFKGFVSGFDRKMGVTERVSATVTITVSGPAGF